VLIVDYFASCPSVMPASVDRTLTIACLYRIVYFLSGQIIEGEAVLVNARYTVYSYF